MAGASVWEIFVTDTKNMFETTEEIEAILREGLSGKLTRGRNEKQT